MPVIWAIKPGVGDTSWSTDTLSPACVGNAGDVAFVRDRCRHGLRCALPYMHAEHTGTGHFASRLGMMFNFAIACSLANPRWPHAWWYCSSSAVAVGVARSSSSRTIFGLDLAVAGGPLRFIVCGASGICFVARRGSCATWTRQRSRRPRRR